MRFPNSSVGKESACNAGDLGSIPAGKVRLGRSPGEGNGNPLQYSCLENPMGRKAWQATVHGVARVGHDLATKPPPAYPSPADLPNPGIKLGSLALQVDSLPTELKHIIVTQKIFVE